MNSTIKFSLLFFLMLLNSIGFAQIVQSIDIAGIIGNKPFLNQVVLIDFNTMKIGLKKNWINNHESLRLGRFISHQLSIVNYQSSIINRQLSIINYPCLPTARNSQSPISSVHSLL